MTTADYLIDSILVLLVLFQIKERTLTNRQLIRPLIILGIAVANYLHGIPTQGNDLLLVNALNRRDATVFRLVGLALISWTIFRSKSAPATNGRGLVVLITLVVAIVAWLVWTFWSCRVSRMTPDVYVLALAGGLLATADLGSAASAFVFVAATVAGVGWV